MPYDVITTISLLTTTMQLIFWCQALSLISQGVSRVMWDLSPFFYRGWTQRSSLRNRVIIKVIIQTRALLRMKNGTINNYTGKHAYCSEQIITYGHHIYKVLRTARLCKLGLFPLVGFPTALCSDISMWNAIHSSPKLAWSDWYFTCVLKCLFLHEAFLDLCSKKINLFL